MEGIGSKTDDQIREEFVKSLTNQVESSVHSLYQVWEQIGIKKQMLVNRCQQTLEHFLDLGTRMKEEEEYLLENLTETVKSLLEVVHEYCTDLGLPVSEFEETTPLDMKKKLESHVEELKVLRDARLDRLQVLRHEEEELCECLHMEPHTFARERNVPTEGDLEELVQHVGMLLEEKKQRRTKYAVLRSDIKRVLQILKRQPETELEQELCSDFHEGTEVELSQDKLHRMKTLLQELKDERVYVEQRLSTLKEKLAFLWDFLQEDQLHREAFLKENAHIGRSGLEALEQEIARCHELRKANMGRFIANLRQELQDWWSKCRASHQQKMAFQQLLESDDYTEDLLKAHEQEVLNWRNMYQKYEGLFVNVDKIAYLFQKALKMQQRANDPSRFYNRGGQLLREEKERKNLLQKIPKMQEELLSLAAQYEENFGTAFTVGGLSVDDYLTEQWALLQQDKENEKLQRKHRKEEELSAATPRKVARNGTLTPHKTPGGTSMSVRGMTLRTPNLKAAGTTLLGTTPMKSRKKILMSPVSARKQRAADADLAAGRSAQKMGKTSTPVRPNPGASMVSLTYNSFANQLNDPVRSNNKRSTMNRSRGVLVPNNARKYTNTGSRRKRFSNGRTPRLNLHSPAARSPSGRRTPSASTSTRGGRLQLQPPGQMPFLF